MAGAPPHDDAFPAVDSAPGGPDELSEASDPHGEWWLDGPIFSTEHRGSSITSPRPGARPGRFTGSMVARLAATFVFWIGFAFLALPRLVDPIAAPPTRDLAAHGWWWVIVVLATVMMVVLGPTFGFRRRAMEQYGQLGSLMVVTALVITAAFLVALLIHLGIDIDCIRSAPPTAGYADLPDTQILLIFLSLAALATLLLLIAFPFSLSFAVRPQRRIAAIRDTGTRHAGWLEELDFRHGRIGHPSQFSVRVGFETPEGTRIVAAHMEAAPERVPLEGEPLLVIVSTTRRRRRSRERFLIEPDPDRPLRSDPDSRTYTVATDGGGG